MLYRGDENEGHILIVNDDALLCLLRPKFRVFVAETSSEESENNLGVFFFFLQKGRPSPNHEGMKNFAH